MAALIDNTNAPRSILTLSTFRTRVRDDLGLSDSSFLTDANLLAWGNEGQDRLARALRWYRTFVVMGTTADVKEYAIPEPSAGRCIQIEEVRYDNEQLEVITLSDLLRYDWNYQQAASSRPEFYYLRGAGGFGLHATPDTTDADILTVIYVALPPRVSLDADEFYCPQGGEDYIVAFAKRRASEKDIHGEGARRIAMYRQEEAEILQELKRQVDQGAEREEVALGMDGLEYARRSKVPSHTTITHP